MQSKNSYFYSILIGCNKGGLKGPVNDSILFWNYLNDKHIINPKIYHKPILLRDDKNKITSNFISKNLKDIHNHANENNKKYHILFFYAGHGYQNGVLGINGKINSLKIYEMLTHGSNSNNKFDLTIVLDCCHSGSFPLINNFKNIDKIKIITSCSKDQSSTETITEFNSNDFKYEKPKLVKNNYISGIFTYKLIYLLKKHNLEFVNDYYIILQNKYWIEISLISKQTLNYYYN